MKMMTALVLALVSFGALAHAAPVASKKTKVELARVVSVVPLELSGDVQVSASLVDLGGSTDVSPTQKIYLTLYAKGEMFSTDAVFEIASILGLKSVRAVSPGIYEIVGTIYDETIHDVTYTINSTQALKDMKAINCGGDFDCAASYGFKSKVYVTSK